MPKGGKPGSRPKAAVTASRTHVAIGHSMERNETRQGSATEAVVLESSSVYESLCNKINLKPVSAARPLEAFQDNDLLSESSADERLARAMSVFMNLVVDASKPVDR